MRLTCVEFCQESRSGTVHVRTELNPEAVCRCQVAGESGTTVSADQSTVNISLPQLHVVIVTGRMMKNIKRSVKRRIISKYITCVILEYVRRIDNQACQRKKCKIMYVNLVSIFNFFSEKSHVEDYWNEIPTRLPGVTRIVHTHSVLWG